LTWVIFDPARSNFFYPKGKKLENLGFLGEIFPNPNQKWPILPKQQKIDPTQPGSNFFDPDPSLEGSPLAWSLVTHLTHKSI